MSPDFLIALTILSNFVLVATSRVNKAIQVAVVQGVLLGLIPLAMGLGRHPHILFMVAATIAVKGWFIPFLLRRAIQEVHIHREVDPYVGYTVSLMLCALGTGLSLILAHILPLKGGTQVILLVPAALSTLFTGFLMLVSRRKALTQVVGFLILENGIYLFGLLLIEDMPMLVETGILLDLFVGVFVMGIVINHIRTAFDSTDTRHLAELKD
jgi:hydrogenase-4 component E